MKNRLKFRTIVLCWIVISLFLIELGTIGSVRTGIKSLLHGIGNGVATYYRMQIFVILISISMFFFYQAGIFMLGKLSSIFLLGKEKKSNNIIMSFLIGWGITALLALGLSLTGLAFRYVFLACGIVCLAQTLAIIVNARSIKDIIKLFVKDNRMSFVFVGAVFISIISIGAFAPEIDGDVISIHFGTPEQIMRIHKMVEWPLTIYDDYPPLYEMLLLPIIGTAGETSAKLMNIMLLVFLAFFIYRISSKYISRKWAYISTLIAITNPFICNYISVSKNDLILCIYTLAAFDALLNSLGSRGRYFFLCGLMIGFVFITKYTGGIILPAFIIAGLLSYNTSARNNIHMIIGFFLISIPILLKNYLFTGNPTYPFMSIIFSGPFTSALSRVRMWEHATYVTIQDPNAMNAWVKIRDIIGGLPFQEDCFARWFMLLPALLLVKSWSQEMKFLLITTSILFIEWFFGPALARYGIFLFPLGYLLAIIGISTAGRIGTALAVTIIFIQAAHSLLAYKYTDSLRVAVGAEGRQHYIDRHLTSFSLALNAMNEKSNESDKILAIGTNRIGWFKARVDYSAFAGPEMPAYEVVHESFNETDIAKRIREYGWKYVIYNSMTAFFWRRSYADDAWTEHEIALWGKYWSKNVRLEWESPTQDPMEGYFRIYKVTNTGREMNVGLLPGIEAWIFRMETDLRNKHVDIMQKRLNELRYAVGYYGMVDFIDWGFNQVNYSDSYNYSLLSRAVQKGFSNYEVFAALAYFSTRALMPNMADYWMQKALQRNPTATQESFIGDVYRQ